MNPAGTENTTPQSAAVPIQPGFMVLQSNRLEQLRQVTVTWLGRHPLTPLENETLLVQSNGIAQWLKLALAADADAEEPGCGIAAAMNISLPGRFHWQAYRAVLGNLPETSPYDKTLLSWRLLRLLPTLLAEPEFEALHHFLSEDSSQRKQFQLAQRLADLLDQYQIYRADWLQDWARGVNRITRNNQPIALPGEQSWQAELWRRLLHDIAPEARNSGRAQVHQQFLEACTTLTPETRPVNLPRRVVVFGISSLPRQSLEVLAAIARCTQVLLCVHNPCTHYWGDIIEPHMAQRLFAKPYKRTSPRADLPAITETSAVDELFLRGNPLLAAWGKQGRDYIRLLDEHDERAAYEQMFHDNKLNIDLFEEPCEDTLLGRIQSDIFHLRSIDEARAASAGIDVGQGLSFHIAHSTQREVEILQDHLLGLFANDPTLRPRDILVMVPDINQFAPHIQAVFGRINRDDNRFIPFTISDQGKRHQAPIYLALSMLMNLSSSRFAVSELLDLMDVPALQKAFDLDVADKALLHRWVEGAGIRWGLNAEQRVVQGMPAALDRNALEQNTWHFGLRRMLLGYAVGDSDAWQDIEPFAEVGGLSAAVTGKLTHLLRVLEHYWHLFRQPADVHTWSTRISALLNECFVAADDRDAMLISRAEQRLQSWTDACAQAGFSDVLPIEVVSEFFLESLDELDLSQRFLAGAVNFATLMPMRAIPFQHICLLGMNDGDYPRQVTSVDFDLMRQDYRPGDRSRREDDRYLFLEALLSARQSLSISWAGRSIRDNSERPPSVLVAQLRDYIKDTVTNGQQALDNITHEYPLQPFSAAYFNAGSTLTTYAAEWTPDTGTTPGTRSEWLASDENSPQVIGLQALSALLRNPAAVFFEKRLGVVFASDELTGDDHEAFAINGLSQWQIQDQLIHDAHRHLRTSAPTQDLDIEALLDNLISKQQRQGGLPMPPFADLYHTTLTQPLIKPLQRCHDLICASTEVESLPVQVGLADNTLLLEDSITDVRNNADGRRLRYVMLSGQIWAGKSGGPGKTKSKVKWHYLARHWPAHLAAQLHGPVTTHVLGPATNEVLAPLDAGTAQRILVKLLTLYRQNLQQPLAAEVKTSCVYLTADPDKAPLSAAQTEYEGSYSATGQVQSSEALSRLWPDFTDLLGGQLPGAAPSSGADAVTSAFVRHSTELYQDLIQHWQLHREHIRSDEEVES
ncbi:exodeoxyribonuclease V subunit gamma [Pseudohongiella sp.]|uniref:RecC C-terminal domain-containing protein n=1 Tax=marine sediment metagenome TaxID=412755 RepID=A0A0F9W6G2_9ZZZZ|nr:exodeoxyribonuclease V subunit gamma [Pseudohongiella sp.]